INTADVPLLTIGMSSKCCTFSSSEFTVVTYIVLSMRIFPEGVIALFFAIASTTWSGERLKRLNFSGSVFTITDLELEPKGGGADNPDIVANIGRIRLAASS